MPVIEVVIMAALILGGAVLLAALTCISIVWWLFRKAKGTMKP